MNFDTGVYRPTFIVVGGRIYSKIIFIMSEISLSQVIDTSNEITV